MTRWRFITSLIDHVSTVNFFGKILCNTLSRFYGIDIAFSLFNVTAGCELSMDGVVYGDEEDAIARIPARDWAMQNCEQRQETRPDIEKTISKKLKKAKNDEIVLS